MSQFNAMVPRHRFNETAAGRSGMSRTPAASLGVAPSGAAASKEARAALKWDTAYVCRSENSREVGQSVKTDGPPIMSQDRSSSALVISGTIYISNRFSCKLHASTLTKTKDRTINYRQIQVH